MSYRLQDSSGQLHYRRREPKATVSPRAVRMPDVSAILVEGESKATPTEEGPIHGYKCRTSGHLYTFWYRPSRRQLTVEFHGNGERYLYENVSRRLYEGLIREDQEGGSPGHYFHTWISGKPEKHAFRKLN